MGTTNADRFANGDTARRTLYRRSVGNTRFTNFLHTEFDFETIFKVGRTEKFRNNFDSRPSYCAQGVGKHTEAQ
jgi:hypothetical protein